MALQYGKLKEANRGYGKVIAGTITNEFTDFLLSLLKPTDARVKEHRLYK